MWRPAARQLRAAWPGAWIQRMHRLLKSEPEPVLANGASTAAAVAARASDEGPQTTRITTLPNGLRVCSENSYGQIATVGVLVDAGSRSQTLETVGVAHLIDRMAFKSTRNRSVQDVLDELFVMGGNITAMASRESIMYTGTVFRHHVPRLVDLIADTIRNPSLLPEELEQQKINAAYEYESLDDQTDMVMSEMMQLAAYHENTIGLPLLCPKDVLDRVSVATLADFRAKYFRPSNMIFAGAGVDHAELVDMANEYLGGPWSVPGQEKQALPPKAPARYTGGELLIPNPSLPLMHMSIGFEGVSIGDPDLYAVATLNMMMGGGGSFSVGGPGKGMYSRFYTNVLNLNARIESAQANNISFTDTGLFMVNGSSLPRHAPVLVEVILKELRNMNRGIKRDELSRARNQLKSSLLMNLEAKAIQFEDIARQVQAMGLRIPVDEVCANIDAVTEADIVRVVQRILKSPMTLAVAGDLTYAPRLKDLARRL